MPTLSASDYTQFLKFQAAQLAYANGAVPKTVQTLMADRKLTDSIKKLKQDTDAVPAVWCGVSNPDNGVFELLLIFGIWKNFDIDGTSHIKTRINLEVEEI